MFPEDPRAGPALADEAADQTEALPNIVLLILSALESGSVPDVNRRRRPRASYRTKGTLRLFGDDPGQTPRVLYTRDFNAHGLGFILPDYLSVGCTGLLRIAAPAGGVCAIHCTVTRCRQVAPDWFEGAVAFTTSQAQFEPNSFDAIKRPFQPVSSDEAESS